MSSSQKKEKDAQLRSREKRKHKLDWNTAFHQ